MTFVIDDIEERQTSVNNDFVWFDDSKTTGVDFANGVSLVTSVESIDFTDDEGELFETSIDAWYEFELEFDKNTNSLIGTIFDGGAVVAEAEADLGSDFSFSKITIEGDGTDNKSISYFDSFSYIAPVTISLASSDVRDGKIIRVVDSNGNASTDRLTVATEGDEEINGEPDTVINTNYEAVTFQSDGTDWYIISRMGGGDDGDSGFATPGF